ncbi:hypothetical protein [Falsirhodobacter sp. 20TX0035]|uniref:hypothetical protein n=1 Tax=Falsirhodobacter sp. 20TX0035 TaxID=3022019 RepID=UPI00232D6DDA|nr:hypothetical protein [Falsirhodobacter sp. 20TX0035]MDB6453332.1 hypothetical protein [Falsirhodobacter sp. 20TX0035]MDB6453568.1 hypothetical protein [Falsirhodobacter sp. 20TX0035]
MQMRTQPQILESLAVSLQPLTADLVELAASMKPEPEAEAPLAMVMPTSTGAVIHIA